TVAGYGSEECRLKTMTQQRGLAGSVEFAGRVEPDGMPALLDAHDVFLNASVLDNQPVSILEAFASGLPVVTTAAGDIPAMVSDGRSGLLVPVEDAAAMARAVLSLLANPARAAAL